MALDHAKASASTAVGASTASAPEGVPGTSVMGRDILVTGNIEATVDLMIEGRVVGDVTCATLVLGPDSAITGRIRAERVRVSGKVEGAIETIELAIESSAHVKGDITYTRLRIANGAVVEGTLSQKPGPPEQELNETKLKLVEEAQPKPAQTIHYFE